MQARSCSLPPCPLFRDAGARPRREPPTSPTSGPTKQTPVPSSSSSRSLARARAVTSPTDITVPTREALALAEDRRGRDGGRVDGRGVADVLGFAAWAPEVINGRCAQIGAVAGIGAKYIAGQNVVEQAHDHIVALLAVVAVVTLASFAPSAFGKTYGGEPRSKRDVGTFTAEKEMIHGRIAMLAIAANVALELFA